MIHESYYWKKELYKSFETVAKFRQLKKPSELSFVKIEKALMIGAYIIRKLDEAQKLPPDFLKRKASLMYFKSQDKIVDHMNWHKIEKHYKVDQLTLIEKDWRFIINQIIHSFSLIYSFDDFEKLDGFYINSDKTKKQAIFLLPLMEVLTMFLTISEGDIVKCSSSREILGKDQNGKTMYGEMKLKEALYSYPIRLDINETIEATLKGNIYLRNEKEWA
ncbi:hypothetical protein [Labilibaculum manganireducens]|uniref:hypothetical protein n=1 Tax=Labilibaculum manganireducens TaxID=1940525 RepID=UPI0029F563EC|nr:hypothetical protein [Labilibaculum manganireducens]